MSLSNSLQKREKKAITKIRVISTLFIILCLTSAMWGQAYVSFSSQMNRILQTNRFQFGPFRLFPAVRLRQFGYSDNIFWQSDVPRGDFTFTISPELDSYVLFRDRMILSLQINPEYVFYYDQKDLRGWNNSYSPEIRWRIFNGFVLSGRYWNSTRRRRPSNEFDEKINQNIHGYSGSLFLERPNNSAYGISAIHETIIYRDVLDPGAETRYERLNRDENTVNLEFYYPIFGASSFFITVGYSDYRFDLPTSQIQNSYSYQILSGIAFPLLGQMRGTLSLGYKIFTPKDERLNGYSGLIGDTGLDYRVSRLGFRILYSRNIPFSLYQYSIYFLEDRIGGGISFYPTRYIRLDYNMSYAKANYPGLEQNSTQDNLQAIGRKDTYQSQNIAIVFRLRQDTGLGFSLNLFKRNSSLQGANFQNKFFGIFITQNF